MNRRLQEIWGSPHFRGPPEIILVGTMILGSSYYSIGFAYELSRP